MDSRMPNVEVVGAEFDKWLNYNGDEQQGNTSSLGKSTNDYDSSVSRLPISPTSTANGDIYNSAIKQNGHTAQLIHDLPTPSHSSGSPEMLSHQNFRLSGDTLREDDNSVYRQNNLKRKTSPTDTSENGYQPVAGKPSGSKRPHNVIEKRYRANLNEKIAELRDSVPALRVLKKSKGKEEGNISSGEEDLNGLTPSNKLNKASILTKAVEYIRHLEFRTKKLEEENKNLKERLRVLDKVIADGGDDAARNAAFTSQTTIESSEQTSETVQTPANGEPRAEPRGLIGLPDNLRQMRDSQSQTHYGEVYASTPQRSRLSGKWPQRIMLGSLAGLMVLEGFSETEQGDQSREKALFGIPIEILDGWTFLRSPRLYLATFAEFCRAGGVVPLIKGFMALSILAFLVFAYMFNSKPQAKTHNERTELDAPQAAKPSSPIEVRRRAWSTSMQALHLPHHSFFPEWLAITTEWINYSIRYWIGPQAYTWLTGLSAEDEIARVKAWDIAIDAQLAGGDMEVSRSRAVLTIFGSGTLPQTPLRLMMKAIHVKVVLFNIGLPDTIIARFTNSIATFLAERQWRRARQLHEALPTRHSDRLPGYLAYLLQMDCEDVFSKIVSQRAYNLMYDRPTAEYAEDCLMDVVVEDHAIRSPLDAIAAWRSASALQEALAAAFQNPDANDLLREHIQAALAIAPPGSAAETRALAVHAVLSPGRRHAFFLRAAEAMASPGFTTAEGGPTSMLQDDAIPYFIDSSTPTSARPEIAICLSCAEVMLKLEQDQAVQEATQQFCSIQWPEFGNILSPTSRPTMLSAAPLYFVLSRLLRANRRTSSLSPVEGGALPQCANIAQELYKFLRHECAQVDINQEANKQRMLAPAFDKLVSTWNTGASTVPSRRHSNVSNDTGYVSLDEEEAQNLHSGLSTPKTLDGGFRLPKVESMAAVSV